MADPHSSAEVSRSICRPFAAAAGVAFDVLQQLGAATVSVVSCVLMCIYPFLCGGGCYRVMLVKPRSRRLLPTTKTLDRAMAAPASIGFSSPSAATGIAATL